MRPLRPNWELHETAFIYATSLRAGRFFGHHGSVAGRNDSSTVIGRLRRLGYIRRGWAWIVGEDLREAPPETSTPAQVVEAWMQSPEHRVRILKRKFEDLGVASVLGVADDPSSYDGVTVVAEFGFRKR